MQKYLVNSKKVVPLQPFCALYVRDTIKLIV